MCHRALPSAGLLRPFGAGRLHALEALLACVRHRDRAGFAAVERIQPAVKNTAVFFGNRVVQSEETGDGFEHLFVGAVLERFDDFGALLLDGHGEGSRSQIVLSAQAEPAVMRRRRQSLRRTGATKCDDATDAAL